MPHRVESSEESESEVIVPRDAYGLRACDSEERNARAVPGDDDNLTQPLEAASAPAPIWNADGAQQCSAIGGIWPNFCLGRGHHNHYRHKEKRPSNLEEPSIHKGDGSTLACETSLLAALPNWGCLLVLLKAPGGLRKKGVRPMGVKASVCNAESTVQWAGTASRCDVHIPGTSCGFQTVGSN